MRRVSRTAMFLRAERTGELDDVEDQLFRFARIVDAHPDLSVILDDPTADPAARSALVDRLLGRPGAPAGDRTGRRAGQGHRRPVVHRTG